MARLLSLLSIFVMASLIAGCSGSSTPAVALTTVAPTMPPPCDALTCPVAHRYADCRP